SELRNFWQHGDMSKAAPQVEDCFDTFYKLSQYLGEEIVISGSLNAKRDPNFVVLAETHKPGFKEALQEVLAKHTGTSKTGIRVVEASQLVSLKETHGDELLVLVRSDFVVGSSDAATLRAINEKLDHSGRDFAAGDFGQRVSRAYEGGGAS